MANSAKIVGYGRPKYDGAGTTTPDTPTTADATTADAAEELFAGARACLQVSGGPLVLYGPYRFQGAFTSPSNEEFDASLRAKDPSWGVRDVDDLDALARGHGLRRVETIPLPANNHALVFRR